MPPRGTTTILGSQGSAGALGQTDTQTEELLARAAAMAQVYGGALKVDITPRRPAGAVWPFHVQVTRPDGVPIGGYYIVRFALAEMKPGVSMFVCALANQADGNLHVDISNGADRISADTRQIEFVTGKDASAVVLVSKAVFTAGLKVVAGVETGPLNYVNFYEMRDAQ